MDFIQNECLISGKIFTMIFYEDVFFCHNQKKVSTLNLSFTRNSTPWFQFFGRPTIPFDDGVTTGSMSAVSVATSCPSHITGVAGLLCCTLGFEMDLFAFLTSLLFFFSFFFAMTSFAEVWSYFFNKMIVTKKHFTCFYMTGCIYVSC